jgi:hypothetical protein
MLERFQIYLLLCRWDCKLSWQSTWLLFQIFPGTTLQAVRLGKFANSPNFLNKCYPDSYKFFYDISKLKYYIPNIECA